MDLPDTSLQSIVNFLTSRIGLDPASIGKETVERALHKRMHAVHAESAEWYLAQIQSSRAELERLVDAVAVPETWFFRDASVFAFLGKWAARDWKPTYLLAPLRILSLPCSSGEEPYSIAMALLDSGFPAERVEIDAIDLREPALEKARRRVYSRNSFRGGDASFRDRYFDAVKEGFRIRDLPFDAIRFRQGNILEPGLLDVSAYDVVFCRNLLIYFDLASKTEALAALKRSLRPAGVLFVGHSETLWVSSQPGFAIIPEPHVFAVRLASDDLRSPLRSAQKKNGKMTLRRPDPPPVIPRKQVQPAASAPVENQADHLKSARDCANRGDFEAARGWVDKSLRGEGPTPEAFVLLGLMAASEGRHSDAARLFEKALYLEPEHEEALTLLALERERSGDPSAAGRLRDRLKRTIAARNGEARG